MEKQDESRQTGCEEEESNPNMFLGAIYNHLSNLLDKECSGTLRRSCHYFHRLQFMSGLSLVHSPDSEPSAVCVCLWERHALVNYFRLFINCRLYSAFSGPCCWETARNSPKNKSTAREHLCLLQPLSISSCEDTEHRRTYSYNSYNCSNDNSLDSPEDAGFSFLDYSDFTLD